MPEFAEAFKCSRKAKVSLWFASDKDILLTLCVTVEPSKRRPMYILVIVLILNLHRAVYIAILFLSISIENICLICKMRQGKGVKCPIPAPCYEYIYNTPLVLGTSFPPVLWIASRMASARALNADSALTT